MARKRSQLMTKEVRSELKKNVGLVHSSSALTLVARQLFNWLLYQAFDNLDADRTHEMPLPLLKAAIGWGRSNNDDDLRSALVMLTSTSAQFNLLNDNTGEEIWQTSALLSGGEIESGIVRWRYDPAMAKRLHNPSIYAVLNLAESQKLSSNYSYCLYEQVVRFAGIGRTSVVRINTLRLLIGATAATYDDFKFLKSRVLEPAIREINAITDLNVTPKYIKEGRAIGHVQFMVERKAQKSLLSTEPGTAWTEGETAVAHRMKALGCSAKVIETAIQSRDLGAIEAAVAVTERELAGGKIHTSASRYLNKVLEHQEVAPVTSQETIVKQAENRVERTRLQGAEINERKSIAQANLQAVTKLSGAQIDQARLQFERKTSGAQGHWIDERQEYRGTYRARFALFLKGYAATLLQEQTMQPLNDALAP